MSLGFRDGLERVQGGFRSGSLGLGGFVSVGGCRDLSSI